VPVRVALTHPHLHGTGFDLPVVEPVFTDYVKSFGLQDRLEFAGGDFFADPLPTADVLSFGHVFHGQSHDGRRELVCKAREALPPSGALIVYDAMTMPGRSKNRFHSLLSSLNIMLETRDGYESTTSECADSCASTGSRRQGAAPHRPDVDGVRLQTLTSRPKLIGSRAFQHVLVIPPVSERQRGEVEAYAHDRGVELLEWPRLIQEMISFLDVRRNARNQTDHVLRVLPNYGFLAPQKDL